MAARRTSHRIDDALRALPVLALVLAVLLWSAAAPASAKPERIVSLNLCTDQLLLLLAEPERIASLSFVGAQPANSAMAEAAGQFPINHGLTEEILRLKPDLVLTAAFEMRPTTRLLEGMGFRIVGVPLARDLGDIRTSIRRVAAAIGEEAKGETLIEEFERRLDAAGADGGDRPTAALFHANSFTSGSGTLPHHVLEAAGFKNLAETKDLSGYAKLPMESLIMAQPDFVIVERGHDEAPALAREIFSHPALADRRNDWRVIDIPGNLWNCGTPVVAEAVEILAEARRRLGSTDE